MPTSIPNQTEKCKGAMIATAIGDALGWPNEPRSKNKLKKSKINDSFIGWTRRCIKPCFHDEKILPGEYSDDTQLTLSIARSLITGNWEEYFAEKELPFWLSYERGGGRALLKASESCKKGVLLWKTKNTSDYFNAGGNGAVMRILPHVVIRAQDSKIMDLIVDVVKDTIITHGHPRAILGATCYAYALDYLLRKDSVLEYGELITAVMNGKNIWGAFLSYNEFSDWLEVANNQHNYEYLSEWEDVLSKMVKQLEYIKDSLKKGLILDDTNVLTQLECFSKSNGAGDVAILASIYLASRYANNPVLGIKIPAFSYGADTDTIASITGGLLGMLCGINWIPINWKMVQDYDCLIRITDILLSDSNKKMIKTDTIEVKNQNKNLVNTAIGRMYKTDSFKIQNGTYSVVTVSKWESALGQTIYTKEMRRLNNDAKQLENKIELPKQPSLFDIANKSDMLENNYAKDVTQKEINLQNSKKHFVLQFSEIDALLNEPLFQRISFKKILQILSEIIGSNNSDEMIAKKLNVKPMIVKYTRKFLK